MPTLKPFHGVRFSSSDELKDLWCPPYDVISPEEQEHLYQRHPHNAVRLELPKATRDSSRYDQAAATFQDWMAHGVLTTEASPSLYVYRQDYVGADDTRRSVVGVIGGLVLESFGADAGVLPHERTMPGPKKDRLALMEACPLNVSPIYSIYRGGGGLTPYFDSLKDRPTLVRFADQSGTLHRTWVVDSPAEVEMLAAAVGAATIVIADGHHRYETALEYHRIHADEGGDHDSIMCFCVDADAADLKVLPYNRAIPDVDPTTAGSVLIDRFGATPLVGRPADALASSSADHVFVFLIGDESLLVEMTDAQVVEVVGTKAPAWRSLDVVALHEVLLPAVLAEASPSFIFSKDADEVTALVDRGEATMGILLKPLSAVDVVEVARSGERMPQKASYFWPKAVTGLVFHSLR